MDELINRLNKFLASSYTFYLKAHFYHWNVEGPDFPQYHKFFGKVYDEVYSSIDDIAEQIRQLDGTPHNSPSMLLQNSYIKESKDTKYVKDIVQEFVNDVNKMSSDLLELNKMAERFSEMGLSNFLQDRHAAFRKHAWMFRSILKEE